MRNKRSFLFIMVMIVSILFMPINVLGLEFSSSINNVYEIRRPESFFSGLAKTSQREVGQNSGENGWYLGYAYQYLPYKVAGTSADNYDYAVYCTKFGLPSPASNSYLVENGSLAASTCTKSDWSTNTNENIAISAGIANIVRSAEKTPGVKFSGGDLKTYYENELAINRFLYDRLNEDVYIQNSEGTNKITLFDQNRVDNAKTEYVRVKNFFDNNSSLGELKVTAPTDNKLTYDASAKIWKSNRFQVTNLSGKYADEERIISATIVDSNGKEWKNYAYVTIFAGSGTNDLSMQVGVCNNNSGNYCSRITKFETLPEGEYTIKASIGGEFNYRVAQNYSCGSLHQSITPTFTEAKTFSELKELEFKLSINGKGKIVINKVDADTKAGLSGAVINVKSDDGKINQNFPFNNLAQISITNLPNGTYTITEVTAPKNYKKSEKSYQVVISDTNLTETITIENTKENEEPSKTQFVLKKFDQDGKNLSGSTFRLYMGSLTNDFTLDSSSMQFNDQPVNERICVQEIEAPDGYKLNNSKICFTISENGEITLDKDYDFVSVYKEKSGIYGLRVTNYPSDKSVIKIKKVDSKDKTKVLKGAKLHIVDSNGKEVVESWVTTEDYYVFTGLAVGKYYIEEIEAPEGYSLNKSNKEFEIESNDTNLVIEVVNDKIVDVPDTLSNMSKLLIILAITGILTGAILIYKSKFSEVK